MRKRISYLLILSTLFVAVFPGCEKSNTSVDNTDEFSSVPITFSLADYTATVKGPVMDETRMQNFGVYSLMEYDGTSGGRETMKFMENVKVEKTTTGTSTTWNTSTPYYWPQLPDKKLSFVAYTPYNEDSDKTSIDPDNGMMTVCHSVSENPSNHVDLCVSRVAKDKTYKDSGEPIPLVFSHTLASLTFAANYIGDNNNLPEDCVVMVDEIKLSNIQSYGEVTVNNLQTGAYFEWNNINDPKTIMFSRSGNDALNNIPVPPKDNNNHENISFTEAFLIPQKINPDPTPSKDDVTMYVTFVYVENSTNNPIAQFSTQLRIPSGVELLPSTKTVFAFTIDVTNASLVSFTSETVKVQPWVDSGNWDSTDNDIDIK